MQSLNINQMIMDGLAPLSYVSQPVVRRLLDMNDVKENSTDDISKSSILLDNFPRQSLSMDQMHDTIVSHSSFLNKNITALLRSALTAGVAAFRRALSDFKMAHKRILSQELNQHDKYRNTLIWYLAVAGLFGSIEEMVRWSSVELDVNATNGSFNRTILHYAVNHANLEEIRIVLDIGVDTNLRDRYGRAALHYVAWYGAKDENDVEITELLVDHGTLPKYEF